MFCTNCGAQLKDNSTFCTNCGLKLEDEQPQTEITSDETTIIDPVSSEDLNATCVIGLETVSSVDQATAIMDELPITDAANQQTTVIEEPIPTASTYAVPENAFEPNTTKYMPAVQQVAPHPPKEKSNKKPVIITIIVCIIVLLAVIGGLFAYTQIKKQQETHAPIPVEFVFNYSGNAAEQPIGIPLLIQGSDLDNNPVEKQVLATPSGQSIDLLAGTYNISIAGNPISTGGVVYQTQGTITQELEIPVPSADSETSTQPVIPDLNFSFEPVAPDKITDQQIETIKSWMTNFDVSPSEIQSITTEIVNKRNAEVARNTLEKEKAAALAANPSVIYGTSVQNQSQVAQLTGTVRYEYVVNQDVSDSPISRGYICYLELPKTVQVLGSQYGTSPDTISNKIIIPDSYNTYKDKVVTISAQYVINSTASTAEAAVSHIHTYGIQIIRVFE